MNKYLLVRYDPIHKRYGLYRIPTDSSANKESNTRCVYQVKVEKSLFVDTEVKKNSDPLIHSYHNGTLYVTYVSGLDSVYEFNSDEEALLWFELTIKDD